MKRKKTTEDYLKTIFTLSQKDTVRGVDIARKLRVSRPTVSVTLKELEKEGFLFLDGSRKVYLTEKG